MQENKNDGRFSEENKKELKEQELLNFEKRFKKILEEINEINSELRELNKE